MVKIEEVCRYCIEICMGGGKKLPTAAVPPLNACKGPEFGQWGEGGKQTLSIK